MQTRPPGPTRVVAPLLVLATVLIVVSRAAATPQTTPSATPSVAAPAPAPQHTLAEGFAKLQAGDAAGAVEIVEPITVREPKNVRAWRVLGGAYMRTRQYDKALAAYAASLQLEPDNAVALYNTGVVHALQGQKDAAFDWLGKAKATGKVDMTQIAVDDDLATVRDDPRFAALLPTRDELAHPFVERVRIVREWDGEGAGDQFGWIARNIGDVDGDHIPDVVTSAPTKNVGGAKAGRVYVYSTRSGKLLWTADGAPGDQLGTGVEGAGDTNHDGIPDVVAGAPFGGKAFVYSGKDGHLLLTLTAES
jgi:hypothetical protein